MKITLNQILVLISLTLTGTALAQEGDCLPLMQTDANKAQRKRVTDFVSKEFMPDIMANREEWLHLDPPNEAVYRHVAVETLLAAAKKERVSPLRATELQVFFVNWLPGLDYGFGLFEVSVSLPKRDSLKFRVRVGDGFSSADYVSEITRIEITPISK